MPTRDLYEEEVDFAAIGLQDPDFRDVLKKNGQLDFSDPKAVQQLTKSLLKRDFDLQIDLPDDRLCPPVPNRYNYILWLQDLVDSTSETFTDQYEPDRKVVGLDIGAGASCIYPLLGCRSRHGWKFGATDTDEKSMRYAKKNILCNDLKARIRPLQTAPFGPLIPLDELGLESIDFTMCNPPFYSSYDDLLSLAEIKSKPPHTACTGSESEMVTPGGEVAFVTRMIQESKALKDRCQWFTSMLGKYASVEVIVKKLRNEGVGNYAVKDLIQGSKTKRWVIGWSWQSLRPAQAVARSSSSVPKGLLPSPAEYVMLMKGGIGDHVATLQATMSSLDIRWRFQPAINTGVGFASENVWSRAARRKGQTKSDSPRKPVLGFKIRLQEEKDAVEVVVRWLQGLDSVLFESFCGMLKRKLTN